MNSVISGAHDLRLYIARDQEFKFKPILFVGDYHDYPQGQEKGNIALKKFLKLFLGSNTCPTSLITEGQPRGSLLLDTTARDLQSQVKNIYWADKRPELILQKLYIQLRLLTDRLTKWNIHRVTKIKDLVLGIISKVETYLNEFLIKYQNINIPKYFILDYKNLKPKIAELKKKNRVLTIKLLKEIQSFKTLDEKKFREQLVQAGSTIEKIKEFLSHNKKIPNTMIYSLFSITKTIQKLLNKIFEIFVASIIFNIASTQCLMIHIGSSHIDNIAQIIDPYFKLKYKATILDDYTISVDDRAIKDVFNM